MFKGFPGPSLDLLHSSSTQICRKNNNLISEPFLPSEVLGKWLNQLGVLENIMLGTKGKVWLFRTLKVVLFRTLKVVLFRPLFDQKVKVLRLNG